MPVPHSLALSLSQPSFLGRLFVRDGPWGRGCLARRSHRRRDAGRPVVVYEIRREKTKATTATTEKTTRFSTFLSRPFSRFDSKRSQARGERRTKEGDDCAFFLMASPLHSLHIHSHRARPLSPILVKIAQTRARHVRPSHERAGSRSPKAIQEGQRHENVLTHLLPCLVSAVQLASP